MLRILLIAAALFATYRSARAQSDAADQPAYWGKPSVDGGKCCETLAEVRENIDRIDRQILTLMAERGQYVAEAGRFKANPAAVSDPARVEAIIAKVGRSPPKTGSRRGRRADLPRDDRGVHGVRARGLDPAQRGRRGRAGEVRVQITLGFW